MYRVADIRSKPAPAIGKSPGNGAFYYFGRDGISLHGYQSGTNFDVWKRRFDGLRPLSRHENSCRLGFSHRPSVESSKV